MKRFLYVFKYETPDQKKNNVLFGYNERDSELICIMAPNKEKAREWGKKLASMYMQKLNGEEDNVYKGEDMIEEVGSNYVPEKVKKAPMVEFGTYLDIDEILLKKYGQDMDKWQREKVSTSKSTKSAERIYFLYAGIILLIIILIFYFLSKE